MNYVTDADPLGGKGTFSANGPHWATATNSPLSGYKYFASEGGLRVPMIIAGVPGMLSNHTAKALSHVNDIVPTLLEVAGIAAHDGRYLGRPVEPLSGRSLLPLLTGRVDQVHAADEAIGYELAGSAALALEDTDTRMSRLGRSEIGSGEFIDYEASMGMLNAVTIDQITALAADIAERDASVVVVGKAKEKELNNIVEKGQGWGTHSS
jgi:hypothetical protein